MLKSLKYFFKKSLKKFCNFKSIPYLYNRLLNNTTDKNYWLMCTTKKSHVISTENLVLLMKSLFAIKGGNGKGGKFTIKYLPTGKDYTFKISTKVFNGSIYTHVHVETEYLKFRHLGCFDTREGKLWKKDYDKGGRRFIDTDAAKVAAWFLRQAVKRNAELVNKYAEVMHFGKCIRCNRTLTDAASIEAAMGSTCRAIAEQAI